MVSNKEDTIAFEKSGRHYTKLGIEEPSKKELNHGSVNGYTCPQEKMRPDTLDKFIAVLTTFVSTVGCIPGLFKV